MGYSAFPSGNRLKFYIFHDKPLLQQLLGSPNLNIYKKIAAI